MSERSSTLRDLQALLKAAPGPDREIDARIHAEAEKRDIIGPISSATWRGAFFGRSRRPPHDECFLWQPNHVAADVLRYTASNDAALAFVESVLPGRSWCCLHRALRSKAVYNSDLSRLPLEIISAALRLLIAKEERDGNPT